MEDNVLIHDEKYEGKYVAIMPFTKDVVITSGSTSIQVLEEAQKKGIENPVIVYIPKHGSTFLF